MSHSLDLRSQAISCAGSGRAGRTTTTSCRPKTLSNEGRSACSSSDSTRPHQRTAVRVKGPPSAKLSNTSTAVWSTVRPCALNGRRSGSDGAGSRASDERPNTLVRLSPVRHAPVRVARGDVRPALDPGEGDVEPVGRPAPRILDQRSSASDGTKTSASGSSW